MDSSFLALSFRPHAVVVTMQLPASQLGLALATTWQDQSLVTLANTPQRFDETFRDRLRGYVAVHSDIVDDRGTTYSKHVSTPRWINDAAGPAIEVDLEFSAPDDYQPRRLFLRSEAIAEEVVSHKAIVSIRRDFERGDIQGSGQIVGTLRYLRRKLTLEREDASFWRGVWAMFELGCRHIAEGLDHLLFILVLILPAPLLARGRRWADRRSMRATTRHLFSLVTAFTIGHSTTLVFGVLGWIYAPVAPVEVLIAASIAVAAMHAVSPIFTGRETWVAASFGLVHGLAFASTLQDFGLDGWALAASLVAFNVGIEVVQALLLAALVPLLILAAQGPGYRALRTMSAGAAMITAAAWTIERITHRTNAVSRLLDDLTERPLMLWSGLLIVLLLWVGVVRSLQRVRASESNTNDGEPCATKGASNEVDSGQGEISIHNIRLYLLCLRNRASFTGRDDRS